MKCTGIFFAIFLVAATNAGAATIHVPADQPTIQAGIDAAVSGDTVLVADGEYIGAGNSSINPSGKAILIASANGNASCIININPTLGSSGLGFQCISGEDSFTVIHGFSIYSVGESGRGMIIDHSAPRVQGCRFLNCDGFPGGAIHVKQGTVSINQCTFVQNLANLGGAIYLDSSSANIEISTFEGNGTSSINSSSGGAIWVGPTSRLELRNCVFNGNVATASQPYLDLRGGAIFCGQGAQVTIDSSEFSGNMALQGMGGAIFADSADVTITSTVFDSNGQHNLPPGLGADDSKDSYVSASAVEKSFASGGAIYAILSNLTISDCIFKNNQAPYIFPVHSRYRGGAIFSDRSTTNISGSTFVDNAARTGYAIFSFESVLKIDSSIIAFNREIYPGQGAPVACDTFSNVSVSMTCNDIYGNPNGNWLELVDSLETLYNNFSLDPQFCGRSVGNYRLQEDSPCRPELSPCGSLVGALPVEPGCNSCCEGTTGNANLAGSVDLSDLSLLISYLTVTPKPVIPCLEEANINASESIDLSDLSALIAYITAGTYTLPWCP